MSGQGRGRGRGRGGGGGGGRGRGRGRGSSRPNSSSRPGGSRGPPSRQNSSASGGGGGGGGASKPRRLANGQKGADVHTVSESDRIRFTQLLIDFREDHSRDGLTMPADLTNTERKFLHSLAGQLGLKSKSSGKGENRRIAVSRMSNLKKVAGASRGGGGNNGGGDGDDYADDSGLPLLRVGRQGSEALRSYCRRHPPSAVEEAESHMTGSSLLKSVLGIGNIGSNNGNDEQDDDDDDDAGDNVVMSTSTSAATADVMGTANANASPETTEEQVSILQALDELHISSTSQGPAKQAPRKHVDIPKRMALHRAAQRAKTKTKQYKQMQEGRKKLPAYSYRKEVCDIVYGNRVTILSGDTGCGKSTQVPQFLLDDDRIGPTASIVVTQPRRISAISVAERVAAERGEECGKRGGLIGYSVRLESCACPSTQCLFVTPGVLLRRFQSSPDLAGVTHIVIDEIHERDKYTEFLMVALRNLMTLRDDLHVVLMSATIQTHELSVYWTGVGNVSGIPPAVPEAVDEDDMDIDAGNVTVVSSGAPAEVSIPGRTYPVQEFFLEDILEMTGYVNDDGQRLGDQSELDRIDAELGALLQGPSAGGGSGGNFNKPRGGRGKKRKDAPTGDGASLSCIMCGRSGFRSAEELGDHVAMCDGGGGITMEALEDKVRSTNAASIMAFDEDIAAANAQFEEYGDGDGEFEEFGVEDDDIDDGDDDVAGLHHGKWDGESPFGIADVLSSSTTTLTQEEMLSRYQQMHDDEQIDDMLLLEIVRFICSSSYGDGAILIFLPGWAEISEFQLLLESTHPFNNKSKYSVMPLHSGIPSKEQRKVFMRPSKGVRKIVLATNIAETSITIDDVAFVCDTGRAKEKNYDPHLKTSTLQPVWISQASAKQRRGRAGRTKAGVCFHLFSRRRHVSLRPFLESELLRTPLEEMCLQCKKLGLAPGGPEDDDGIPAFLAKALTPPHPKSITNAIELLVELGAMEDETNELTNLGLCLSVLSLEPTVGKMVIWSHLLGCARAASSMGVAMSYKSPFVLPPSFLRKQADDAKVQLSENSESDQITVLNALRAKDGFSRRGGDGRFFDYCRRNFLGVSTMNMISDLRRNTSRELGSLGFPSTNESGYHNRSGDNDPAFLQAAIAAGLYPNVASRRRGESNFSTVTNRKAKVHISSVNACKGQPLNGKSAVAEGDVEFIIYGEMTRGVSSFTMSNTTHLVSPLPLLLLCGNLRVRPAEIREENDEGGDNTGRKGGKGKKSVLSVDDWILFLCSEEEAANLVVLRRRLDNAFLHSVANPSTGLTKLTPAEKDAVDTLGAVLRSAHRAAPGRKN